MKISTVLETPSVRILIFIYENNEVRYTDLTKLIASRGTLSVNVKELEAENLVKRRIIATKPIQAYYSLTDKGSKIAQLLNRLRETYQS